MPDSNPDRRDETYNEEMVRWLARQSFWYRLTHLRRHPEARPIGVSLLFLALILIPVLLVGVLGYYVLLQRYLSGVSFGNLVAQEAGKSLETTNMEGSASRWKAGTVTINELKGEGLPGSWVRKATLTGVRFPLHMSELFRKEWTPPSVSMQRLDLEIRSGLLNPEEAGKLAKQQAAQIERKRQSLVDQKLDPGPYIGKLWIGPEGSLFATNHVLVRDANVRWECGQDISASVVGTTLEADRSDSGWRIHLVDGMLSFGWIHQARLGELNARVVKGVLTIEKASFFIPPLPGTRASEGIGSLSGKIVYGVQPQIDIVCKIENIDVNRLISSDYAGFFSGNLKGEMRVMGSLNQAGTLSTQGALDIEKGFSFGTKAPAFFPLVEVLGGELADVPLRYLEAASGAIRFSLAGNKLKMDSVVFVTADGERIEGQFNCETGAGTLTGVMKLGLKPSTLAEHPLLQEKYFNESIGDLRWMTVPLDGPIKGLAGGFAEGMRTVLKTEVEKKKKTP